MLLSLSSLCQRWGRGGRGSNLGPSGRSFSKKKKNKGYRSRMTTSLNNFFMRILFQGCSQSMAWSNSVRQKVIYFQENFQARDRTEFFSHEILYNQGYPNVVTMSARMLALAPDRVPGTTESVNVISHEKRKKMNAKNEIWLTVLELQLGYVESVRTVCICM
jgi:hypothetical protein